MVWHRSGCGQKSWKKKPPRSSVSAPFLSARNAHGDSESRLFEALELGNECDMKQEALLDLLPEHTPARRDFKIFGHFLEHFHRQIYGGVFDPGSHLSDANGFRRDVIEALRRIKTPVIRWPGGCFVSAYPWKKGVGARVPYYDKAWRVEEPNSFGTDEFVAFCREVGAEPFICTNAGTGTPEDMSDWVEYCNLDIGEWAALRRANGHDKPFKVPPGASATKTGDAGRWAPRRLTNGRDTLTNRPR
jgi:hypothetical protein